MAVAAALLVAPATAAAREGLRSAGSSRDWARVVEIRVSGDAAALSRVKVTARELLLRLDVEPNVKAIDEPETASDEPQPVVIAYVDLRNPSSPSIDIEDGASRQELTRRTLNDVSSLETGVEGVLHVLYLAVESRLQVGVTKQPAPSPQPVPQPVPRKKPTPPAAEQRSPLGFDVGAMFRLSSLGGSRFVPGGGVALEPRVDLGRARVAGLLLSGALFSTSEVAFEGGAAELRPLQVRIVPTLDWPISPDVSACVGVGAGLDALEMRPTRAPELGVARPAEAALDPMLVGLLGARLPIAGSVFLSALASLDLDLAPAVFVARRGNESRPLLALPRLRGGFSLALSFTAAGPRRLSPPAAAE